ncbi:MAG: PHP domain-containing protein [Treponema sp.]|nr:PHP domain-containing protein [Treponema sp.]
MNYKTIINNPWISREERLDALRALERANPQKNVKTGEINNHIHTIYSFSPYTPSMAALEARNAGLEAAGSVDHDSIAAAEELTAAAAELGIGGCVGFEVRVSFKAGADGRKGPFAGRKINNPDSTGIAYMTVQGVPAPRIKEVRAFLDPIRRERLERTREMVRGANALLAGAGLEEIDFKNDVEDRSKYAEGGEITERHLLQAAANKLLKKYGPGASLTEGLSKKFGVNPPPKIQSYLSDPGNPHYLFDLLGTLKSGFLSKIFIQPGAKECIPAQEVCAFARSIGAVPAYAYLGDVRESPTGDKKAERFEDEFIEPLFDELTRLGYQAVTYMPPRNTPEQIRRVQRLCADRGFMEISGVDINSSRQPFNCPEVLEPGCRHLVDTTWALIAHERLASADSRLGLFSAENPLAGKPLAERIAFYAVAGRNLDLKDPAASGQKIAEDLLRGKR